MTAKTCVENARGKVRSAYPPSMPCSTSTVVSQPLTPSVTWMPIGTTSVDVSEPSAVLS